MNADDIRRIFPNASAAVFAANAEANHPRQVAALERHPGASPLAESEVQKGGAGKIHVRVESIRRRLADPDGICEKYAVDCCRYAGLIPNDSAADITLETTQRKAAKGEEEHTKITITYPCPLH